MSANPRRSRPRLVDPDLAALVPGLRPVASTAVALAVLSAAAIIVQAVALASVVDRSLLHHASLRAVTPALAVLGLAILVRALLHGVVDLSAFAPPTGSSRRSGVSCWSTPWRWDRAG